MSQDSRNGPDEIRDAILVELAAARAAGRPGRIEITIEHSDGQVRKLLWEAQWELTFGRGKTA